MCVLQCARNVVYANVVRRRTTWIELNVPGPVGRGENWRILRDGHITTVTHYNTCHANSMVLSHLYSRVLSSRTRTLDETRSQQCRNTKSVTLTRQSQIALRLMAMSHHNSLHLPMVLGIATMAIGIFCSASSS